MSVIGGGTHGGTGATVGDVDPNAVPKSGGTMTGELVVPDVKLVGLTGAVTPMRYVGGNASGPPTSGTWLLGDVAGDLAAGMLWMCTVAGTPGTWVSMGSGRELTNGYAEITSNFTHTGDTTATDITGLTVTVTVGSRPIIVKFDCGLVSISVISTIAQINIVEDGITVAQAFATAGVASQDIPVHREARRSPAAGAHTYKAQLKCSSAAATGTVAASAATPTFIQVIEV